MVGCSMGVWHTERLVPVEIVVRKRAAVVHEGLVLPGRLVQVNR